MRLEASPTVCAGLTTAQLAFAPPSIVAQVAATVAQQSSTPAVHLTAPASSRSSRYVPCSMDPRPACSQR